MNESIGRKYLPHDIPPNVIPNSEGEVFFITINCATRGTNQLAKTVVWSAIMETLLLREAKGEVDVRLVLAMPDHLHGLFSFNGGRRMEDVMRDFKSWIAKGHGIAWQRDFFDHRLRGWESGYQKGEYIRENPVRAGLVGVREEWEFVYERKR